MLPLRHRLPWRAPHRYGARGHLHDDASTAACRRGFDPRHSGMQRHQLSYDGKPDPAAACRRLDAAVEPDVRLPDAIAVIHRNSRAFVLDPESNALALRFRSCGGADRDRLTGGPVLRRVVEEV